jgi:hypothetical protein
MPIGISSGKTAAHGAWKSIFARTTRRSSNDAIFLIGTPRAIPAASGGASTLEVSFGAILNNPR